MLCVTIRAMKALVLYHPSSESGRSIEEYSTDFERRKGNKIKLLSLETREGAAMASLYDVVRYPALLVVDDEGRVQKLWEGDTMPLMDEVSGYLVA